MAPELDKEDSVLIMEKILSQLDRIAEHFREQDANAAANNIAKNTIDIVKIFNETIAPWDLDQRLLCPPRPRVAFASATTRAQSDVVNGNKTNGAGKKTVQSTWANIAATKTASGNRLIKFGPLDAVKLQAQPEEMIAEGKDMRVIWLLGWNRARPLSYVTQRLSHGAIYSMAYSPENEAVCIIFQHAYVAATVLSENTQCLHEYGHGLFRECELIPGLPYPEDEDLIRMSPPKNERRRLTFVRQQLFTNGLNEEQFKKDLDGVIGSANVELVWLFNTGNATVVLSSVPMAKAIQSHFRKRSFQNGPYKDVQVTFSHDPCERPLKLTTQLPYSGYSSSARSYSAKQETPPDDLSTSDSSSGTPWSRRRNLSTAGTVDEDGWQTVRKKK